MNWEQKIKVIGAGLAVINGLIALGTSIYDRIIGAPVFSTLKQWFTYKVNIPVWIVVLLLSIVLILLTFFIATKWKDTLKKILKNENKNKTPAVRKHRRSEFWDR